MDKPLHLLTLQEVSKELKIPMSSVYRLLRNERLVGLKVGKHWRISEEALVAYVMEQEEIPIAQKIMHGPGGRPRGRPRKNSATE